MGSNVGGEERIYVGSRVETACCASLQRRMGAAPYRRKCHIICESKLCVQLYGGT